MYTLYHKKKLEVCQVYKGCLGLMQKINFLNKNKSKNYIGLNIDKRK